MATTTEQQVIITNLRKRLNSKITLVAYHKARTLSAVEDANAIFGTALTCAKEFGTTIGEQEAMIEHLQERVHHFASGILEQATYIERLELQVSELSLAVDAKDDLQVVA